MKMQVAADLLAGKRMHHAEISKSHKRKVFKQARTVERAAVKHEPIAELASLLV
jgi:hypothetical protein